MTNPSGPGRPGDPYQPRHEPYGPPPEGFTAGPAGQGLPPGGTPSGGLPPGGLPPGGLPPGGPPRQQWDEAAQRGSVPAQKGLIGALFDLDFNHLVTPRLIRLWYLVAMLLITMQALVAAGFGLWIATWDDFYAWGWILLLSTPLVWIFEVILVRIFMEAVVVRFKSADHLRMIKDKI